MSEVPLYVRAAHVFDNGVHGVHNEAVKELGGLCKFRVVLLGERSSVSKSSVPSLSHTISLSLISLSRALSLSLRFFLPLSQTETFSHASQTCSRVRRVTRPAGAPWHRVRIREIRGTLHVGGHLLSAWQRERVCVPWDVRRDSSPRAHDANDPRKWSFGQQARPR